MRKKQQRGFRARTVGERAERRYRRNAEAHQAPTWEDLPGALRGAAIAAESRHTVIRRLSAAAACFAFIAVGAPSGDGTSGTAPTPKPSPTSTVTATVKATVTHTAKATITRTEKPASVEPAKKPKPAKTTEEPAIECDSSYSGCVPVDSDVDCLGGSGNGPSYVSGPVDVVGDDVYDLDPDGDGVACE